LTRRANPSEQWSYQPLLFVGRYARIPADDARTPSEQGAAGTRLVEPILNSICRRTINRAAGPLLLHISLFARRAVKTVLPETGISANHSRQTDCERSCARIDVTRMIFRDREA
jgi:hypothetical protein